MRVLFSCIPGFGHFHPMVPLARALQAAGHEVVFATAERFCRNVIEPAGFEAIPAGLSPLQVQEEMAAVPPTLHGSPADAHDEDRFGVQMFAEVAGPAKIPDLIAAIGDFLPALVVHDAVDFGAALAAAHVGLPYVGHSFGALQSVEFWELAELTLDMLWPEPHTGSWARGPMFGYLYLDICPPSLQAPHISEVRVAHQMRPVGFDGATGLGLPPWVADLPPVPTVYVTLGTVFNATPGLFEAILAGLREEPVNVIVTVGLDRDPAELGAQPDNVHVERYLPQSLLFDRCDVVVAHGGSGTTFAALAHGLPALILPQGANQLWNALRCAELGASIALTKSEVGPERVRAAVRSLLQDTSYRARAGDLRREIEAMPRPEQVVGLLEELA